MLAGHLYHGYRISRERRLNLENGLAPSGRMPLPYPKQVCSATSVWSNCPSLSTFQLSGRHRRAAILVLPTLQLSKPTTEGVGLSDSANSLVLVEGT